VLHNTTQSECWRANWLHGVGLLVWLGMPSGAGGSCNRLYVPTDRAAQCSTEASSGIMHRVLLLGGSAA
jgi:hypothetical protein